jgi:hypothetical protein
MSRLAKLQADFQAYLFDDVKGAAFKKQIIDDKKVGVKKRLGIYYDAYRLRIIEALTNVYPKLQVYLGDNLFSSTARAYIDLYPSTYRNLRWYGAEMSEYLRKKLPQHPIAAELAAFEWALGLAFDAADEPVLQLQDLAAIPPEAWAVLKFKFHPSLQMLPLKWNTIPVWKALDNEATPPKPTKINEPCVVWRQHFDSHFRSLDATEFAAIELTMAGASFGELCEKLLKEKGNEATNTAAQYLAGWLNEGLISKVV